MDGPPNRDALIQQFCSFTQAAPEEAEGMLMSSEWNVEAAVALWYQSQEEETEEQDEEMDDEPSAAYPPLASAGHTAGSTTGGRTLGGGPPSSQPASSSQPSSRKPQGGMKTLQDLQKKSSGRHDHDHDDDHDDDGHGQDMFAGGEKSGLAVENPGQNPRDLMERLLQRARDNAPRPGGDDDEPHRSHFTGRGITLGGEGTESRVIEDPNANRPRPLPPVNRTLHIWRNGFSVDDGPLYHSNDPENQAIMQQFLQGRAPLHILNVEHNQEVNVDMDLKRDQDYVAPKKKYKPFEGRGQRLGSPTPGTTTSSSSTSAPAPSSSSAASVGASSYQPANVNESEPTVTLQIRLGDGTRLQSRFNTSHTVGDVYLFVNAASPNSLERPYVLQTTFPSKELTDKSEKLGDMAEFKRGGVVVQKWK